HGDKVKAAFSDALKRAAVKWGVGRYIYRLEGVWMDYDPQRKQIRGVPQLPPWALPKRKGETGKGQAPTQNPAPPEPVANGAHAATLTEPQRLEIKRLLEQCGLSLDDLKKKVKKVFALDDPKKLTEEQATKVIADLQNYHRRIPNKQPVAAPREPGVEQEN